MKITILSLFPSIITPFFENSIMKKVVDKGIISYEVISIRDFSKDKHKRCDDVPYGGGAGMVLKVQPIVDALEYVNANSKTTIFVSPSGLKYTQKLAYDLSKKDELVIICGRYEGLDQRVIDLYVDLEISVGDYVLSSGEVAALVIIDSVYRLLDGVINPNSLCEESFSFECGLLEYPHYTRPYEFRNLKVPDVLLSGHHEEIKKWRLVKSVEKTKKNRFDLYLKYLEMRGEKNDGFDKKN
ncbi:MULTISPECIES: tRNA (guanosine(37)-N1)-methyltransferase TrmD [Borrelia]|uniref:tRNA (guanine-N(1)-)-methyltransferase n=3 Tax=Borrelia TaxID=138 RepID=TRMD_BORDL|nr:MULTISPECIES: tRNA (guanosine(37)-N1)-methyltransferase TrmD [Borrelia]B5RMP3.1 RecName: Full=tRNA (guanine-N(1)-)-methyltransferase; AltName: Full=M1G-methyltransferase; AltName: Full=tRNA [GM37] methyltransferase [Borrelia duttonii Ly]B5RQ39.1 RecName: Full=tRNA (guanine-N(1)-)-methyltransferase; AltName: Full=M1G-methyltransferase; AltName: Full=tRNA [GM37] methyltransferase [Borrelia recurrentis A1]ACH93629.1 tRNA-(guanine-N1)-methyltransferase [Borrelia duttonii Ly]ACH94923.1 tRNA-(guan